MSVLISKRRRAAAIKQIRKVFLNTFAVALTVLPLVSIGVWAYVITQGDGREVAALTRIVRTNPQPFKEPLVSITFDDGWQSTYQNGVPVMQKYGYAATFYVLSGEVTQPEYMSADQIRSLYATGHEIGSHGIDHADLATLSDADVAKELDDSKAFLKKLKVTDDTVTFASPYSSYSAVDLKEITARYHAHRNTEADISKVGAEDMNVGPTLPKRDIMAFTVRKTTPLKDIRNALEYAKAHNAWFVLVYHQVDDSGVEYSVSQKQLDTQMKLIKDMNIKVATVGDVAGEITGGDK